MKKSIQYIVVLIFMAMFLQSCATVLGGRVSVCQRHRPQENEPTRKVRVVALVADIVLWWPGLAIDFLTGAIYRPCHGHYQGTQDGTRGKGYVPEDENEPDVKEGKDEMSK